MKLSVFIIAPVLAVAVSILALAPIQWFRKTPRVDEARAYANEITFLNEQLTLDARDLDQATRTGVVSDALHHANQSARRIAMVQCLQDQHLRRVPFYQGKAVCADATSAMPGA